jgi:hypothetical protein
MAKPLGSHTDKELEGALAEGRLTKRKAAVAEEILRRRKDAKGGALKARHGWMGVFFAAFGLLLFSLKRRWRRQPRDMCTADGMGAKKARSHVGPGLQVRIYLITTAVRCTNHQRPCELGRWQSQCSIALPPSQTSRQGSLTCPRAISRRGVEARVTVRSSRLAQRGVDGRHHGAAERLLERLH